MGSDWVWLQRPWTPDHSATLLTLPLKQISNTRYVSSHFYHPWPSCHHLSWAFALAFHLVSILQPLLLSSFPPQQLRWSFKTLKTLKTPWLKDFIDFPFYPRVWNLGTWQAPAQSGPACPTSPPSLTSPISSPCYCLSQAPARPSLNSPKGFSHQEALLAWSVPHLYPCISLLVCSYITFGTQLP